MEEGCLRVGVHQLNGICSKLQGLQVELSLSVTVMAEQFIRMLFSNLWSRQCYCHKFRDEMAVPLDSTSLQAPRLERQEPLVCPQCTD